MESSQQPDRIRVRRKPQQDRSVQRVEHILRAAETLIERHGVAGLKMTEIAREAGIPIGSLYQYFPERVAIVKALFDRVAAHLQAGISGRFHDVASVDDVRHRVFAAMDWHYQQLRDHPALFAIWVGTETDPELMRLNIADSRRMGDLFLDSIRHLLPADGSDAETRAFLFSHLTGSVVRLAVMADEATAHKLLDQWKAVVGASLVRDLSPATEELTSPAASVPPAGAASAEMP